MGNRSSTSKKASSSSSKKKSHRKRRERPEPSIPEPPPPGPVDPRMPLTYRQHYCIVKSWKGIKRAMEATGVFMFIKLFEDHMDLLNLFEKFQDLRSREEQAESTSLAEHATLVMQTLDQGINSFSDVDKFEVFLTQVGESHRKIAGFRKENFYKIEEPFLYAVRETLQERYTENMDYIYRTSIRFILDTLIKGYEKAEAEEEKEAIAAGAEKPENCEDKKQDNEKKKEDAKKNGDRCPVAHLETQTASAANPPS